MLWHLLRLLYSVSGFVFVAAALAVLAATNLRADDPTVSQPAAASRAERFFAFRPTPPPTLGPVWYVVASEEQRDSWKTALAADQANVLPLDLVSIIAVDGEDTLSEVMQTARAESEKLASNGLPVIRVVDLR